MEEEWRLCGPRYYASNMGRLGRFQDRGRWRYRGDEPLPDSFTTTSESNYDTWLFVSELGDRSFEIKLLPGARGTFGGHEEVIQYRLFKTERGRIDGKRKILAHRLFAEVFLNDRKPLDPKVRVTHNDGDKLNNAVSNLRLSRKGEPKTPAKVKFECTCGYVAFVATNLASPLCGACFESYGSVNVMERASRGHGGKRTVHIRDEKGREAHMKDKQEMEIRVQAYMRSEGLADYPVGKAPKAEEEQWRWIETYYQISSHGRLRRVSRTGADHGPFELHGAESAKSEATQNVYWLKLNKGSMRTQGSRTTITYQLKKRQRVIRKGEAHRLVAEAFLNDGKPLEKSQIVNFKDGDTTNTTVENLELSTSATKK